MLLYLCESKNVRAMNPHGGGMISVQGVIIDVRIPPTEVLRIGILHLYIEVLLMEMRIHTEVHIPM